MPNTDATVRDICINNSQSKGNTALTNDYGQLLSKDIFNNLTGMYYHYDINGESFIYISNNDVSPDTLNFNLFFRKSDFTHLIPSVGNNNKFSILKLGTLFFDVEKGVSGI